MRARIFLPLILMILFGSVLVSRTTYGCNGKPKKGSNVHRYKPVIYLYPEEKTLVNVKVNYPGEFTVTYPEYKKGWTVIAEPDGKLTDPVDQKEYSYLFWEGKDYGPPAKKRTYDEGFIVTGDSVHFFLQEKLSAMGMLPKEYNEFIVFWYPILKQNDYNFIHFKVNEAYDEISTMEIEPKPDAVLRIFMDYQSINHQANIAPQIFVPFIRTGFTVVEWGGGPIESEIILKEKELEN